MEANFAVLASLSCFLLRYVPEAALPVLLVFGLELSKAWSFFGLGVLSDVKARVLLLPTTLIEASMVMAKGFGSSVYTISDIMSVILGLA